MKTLRLSGKKSKDLIKAAELISKGKLVALPTDTVYGLGANALNIKAVKKIFKAKKRPQTVALPILVADLTGAMKLTKKPTNSQEKKNLILLKKMARRFWPGPLTIVIKKSAKIKSLVTAGKQTIGLRVPDNSITRKILKLAGVPLAAPSANPFEENPPKTAEEVLNYFDGIIDAVVDGGKTKLGVASTTICCHGQCPTVSTSGAATCSSSATPMSTPMKARSATDESRTIQ